eukprot:159900-Chlamydomonas_euryale.AAC.1
MGWCPFGGRKGWCCFGGLMGWCLGTSAWCLGHVCRGGLGGVRVVFPALGNVCATLGVRVVCPEPMLLVLLCCCWPGSGLRVGAWLDCWPASGLRDGAWLDCWPGSELGDGAWCDVGVAARRGPPRPCLATTTTTTTVSSASHMGIGDSISS